LRSNHNCQPNLKNASLSRAAQRMVLISPDSGH